MPLTDEMGAVLCTWALTAPRQASWRVPPIQTVPSAYVGTTTDPPLTGPPTCLAFDTLLTGKNITCSTMPIPRVPYTPPAVATRLPGWSDTWSFSPSRAPVAGLYMPSPKFAAPAVPTYRVLPSGVIATESAGPSATWFCRTTEPLDGLTTDTASPAATYRSPSGAAATIPSGSAASEPLLETVAEPVCARVCALKPRSSTVPPP